MADITPKTILNKLPDSWEEKDHALHREYTFSSFKMALSFMNECVVSIDLLNHHPEWSNTYNKIHVILRTHDAGNIVTEKDYALATILEDIYLARF